MSFEQNIRSPSALISLEITFDSVTFDSVNGTYKCAMWVSLPSKTCIDATCQKGIEFIRRHTTRMNAAEVCSDMFECSFSVNVKDVSRHETDHDTTEIKRLSEPVAMLAVINHQTLTNCVHINRICWSHDADGVDLCEDLFSEYLSTTGLPST